MKKMEKFDEKMEKMGKWEFQKWKMGKWKNEIPKNGKWKKWKNGIHFDEDHSAMDHGNTMNWDPFCVFDFFIDKLVP